jgi:FtsP/CotA-like multicopper oxidase with cupredoxin domain
VRVTANTSHSLGILLASCTSGRYPQLSNAAFSSWRQVSQSRRLAVLFAALLWASCASLAGAQERVLQSEGWNAGLRLTEAVDLNSDPRVVEINLEARVARVEIAPDRHVEAWTYDGGLPGPLIRVRVGDRLIVHFSNRLPTPTTVHWHGIRLPNRMDGVPGHSQLEVQPGESFTYDFVVPDAGLFWYHPHVMSAAQVGFGLYGALLVEDPSERVGTADELVLVLSDIEIRGDGTLESPDTGASTGMAFGREGNHLLVNGRIGGELFARSGAPQRWRIVNAAKSRYFQLDVDGPLFTDGQLFTIIGGDGGLLEYPVKRDRLVLTAVIEKRPDHELGARGRPGDHNRIGTLARRQPFARDKPVQAMPGETQVWTVTNKTKWSHPFHLHGFFFQVLDENGSPVRPLVWKDTVDVPFEQTARFVVRFDDRPGGWMYHCHVFDHADGGLMGIVQVGAPDPNHSHHRKP